MWLIIMSRDTKILIPDDLTDNYRARSSPLGLLKPHAIRMTEAHKPSQGQYFGNNDRTWN